MNIPPKYTIVKAYKFSVCNRQFATWCGAHGCSQNCEDAFGLYDANHDGVWDQTEVQHDVEERARGVEFFFARSSPAPSTAALPTTTSFLSGIPFLRRALALTSWTSSRGLM